MSGLSRSSGTVGRQVHGGNGRVVARAFGMDPSQVLDLSFSANPFAPDPTPIVTAHLARGVLRRYPDALDVDRATRALATAIGVDARRVLITNGGAEAIALVATVLGRGWVEDPDFSLYRRHLRRLDPAGPRFRSDPHNPSGALASPGERADVWDEAFYPLATGRWSRLSRRADSGARQPDPLILGSLTKVFACPGLRLGYVVVPGDDGEALGVGDLMGHLKRAQARWAVSTLALASLCDLLEGADLTRWAEAIRAARADLVALLARYGLRARPSDANFVLVDDVPGLAAALAAQGVVVRDCSSFGLPSAVRIAVPDGAGLARLEQALEAVLDRSRAGTWRSLAREGL